jgi:hypothetical protein
VQRTPSLEHAVEVAEAAVESRQDPVVARPLVGLGRGTLRPERSGSYLNFEEDPADPASFFGAETYGRLRDVKDAFDPDELFLANHPIPPAVRVAD